jgi:DNA-binding transcriptional MerR regulator
MTDRLTIGGLARQAGIGVETVRFYQRLGLLRQPRKPVRGNRSYAPEDIAQLRFIRACKGLGLSLKDIGRLTRSMNDRAELSSGDLYAVFRELASALEAERRVVEIRQEVVARLLETCLGEPTLASTRLVMLVQEVKGPR